MRLSGSGFAKRRSSRACTPFSLRWDPEATHRCAATGRTSITHACDSAAATLILCGAGKEPDVRKAHPHACCQTVLHVCLQAGGKAELRGITAAAADGDGHDDLLAMMLDAKPSQDQSLPLPGPNATAAATAASTAAAAELWPTQVHPSSSLPAPSSQPSWADPGRPPPQLLPETSSAPMPPAMGAEPSLAHAPAMLPPVATLPALAPDQLQQQKQTQQAGAPERVRLLLVPHNNASKAHVASTGNPTQISIPNNK